MIKFLKKCLSSLVFRDVTAVVVKNEQAEDQIQDEAICAALRIRTV